LTPAIRASWSFAAFSACDGENAGTTVNASAGPSPCGCSPWQNASVGADDVAPDVTADVAADVATDGAFEVGDGGLARSTTCRTGGRS
jgi:hypothetical protein